MTDALRVLAKQQQMLAYNFEGRRYDVGDKEGFLEATVEQALKRPELHDVAVIMSTVPAATGAVFTQNKICAAPVLISREVNKRPDAQAIVVNSGCANACTGQQGLADAKAMQEITGEYLDIEPESIFVCSTGVIGQFLPMALLMSDESL